MKKPIIALVSASKEEIEGITKNRTVTKVINDSKCEFIEGSILGVPLVSVISGWGKVNATRATTLLLSRYRIRKLIFLGAAGGVGRHKQGEVIIGSDFLYHDFNAHPIIKSHIYPYFDGKNMLHNNTGFNADIYNRLINSKMFKNVEYGVFATGDRIIYLNSHKDKIRGITGCKDFVVDMESAAVAEVCHNGSVVYSIIRIISDNANVKTRIHFEQFLKEAMPQISETIFLTIKPLLL